MMCWTKIYAAKSKVMIPNIRVYNFTGMSRKRPKRAMREPRTIMPRNLPMMKEAASFLEWVLVPSDIRKHTQEFPNETPTMAAAVASASIIFSPFSSSTIS